jgi:hypothetical protein
MQADKFGFILYEGYWKMKVLFLDFDGPLFSDRVIKFDPDNIKPYPGNVEMSEWVGYWKMDPLSVHVLNKMRDVHPFKTVVSSSWKRFVNKEQIVDLFRVNNLILDLHDDYSTPDLSNRYGPYSSGYSGDTRSREIEAWLRDCGRDVDDYLIIDDPMSGASLDVNNHSLNKDNIIMVDGDVGPNTTDITRMRSIVYTWAGFQGK